MFRRSASICELIDAKRKKIVFLQETLYLWEILNIIYNMKTKSFLLCLVLAVSANAQVVYHDASAFPLLGKATETTLTRYERLPDSLQNISRKPLWELGRNSAGLAIRFRSNSTRIAAKWDVLLDRNMNHMTPTGIKGLDLYCLQDGKWMFAGSGRPQGKANETTMVKDMLPEEREYLLYLSLYDGVTSLSIGVDSLSQISGPAVELPVRKKPVVFYGTSILQEVALPVRVWRIPIFWSAGSIGSVLIWDLAVMLYWI